MTRCEICGRYEDCLIVDEFFNEIIPFGWEDETEVGMAICGDCYDMAYPIDSYKRRREDDW